MQSLPLATLAVLVSIVVAVVTVAVVIVTSSFQCPCAGLSLSDPARVFLQYAPRSPLCSVTVPLSSLTKAQLGQEI